jgi:hypothetical protein
MAGRLFLMGKNLANAVLGTTFFRRVRALIFTYKKLAGSAVVLALFAAPFAVQALTEPNGQSEQNNTNKSDQFQEQPPKATSESKENKHDLGKQSSTNVEVQTDASSSASGDGEVDVTINGQKVPVPKNGHVHKSFSDNNNQTSVDVQIRNESSSSNVDSSTSVEVQSNSFTGNDSETRRNPRR